MNTSAFFIAGACILLSSLPARADVTISEKTVFHMMNLPLGDFRTIRMIKKDKCRLEDSVARDQYFLLKLEAREERSYKIMRLDRGVSWEIFPDQMSYTESPLFDATDNDVPMASGNPALDLEFNPRRKKIDWKHTPIIRTCDTLLWMPCTVYHSSVFSASAEGAEMDNRAAVDCRFWVVSENDYIDEVIGYYMKYQEPADSNTYSRFAIHEVILKLFGIGLSDTGLDSIRGFPAKAEIKIKGSMLCWRNAGMEPDIFADEMVSEEFLEMEAAMMEADTGPTLVDTDQALKDSVYDAYKRLFEEILGEIETGAAELFSYSSEIISIDTVTVLPDSLFEIPAGFIKR